jgi:hypothetical protein
MADQDDRQGQPEKQGLPGEESDQNNEMGEGSAEPTKRPPGSAGGGSDKGGESGEGSQSTGHPDNAG